MADLSHLRRTPSRPRLGSKPFAGPAEQGDSGGDAAPARESGTSFGVRPFAPGAQAQPAASTEPQTQHVAVADPPPPQAANSTDPELASEAGQRPPQPGPPSPEPSAAKVRPTVWQPPTVTPIEAPATNTPLQSPEVSSASFSTSDREPAVAQDATGPAAVSANAARGAAEPEVEEAFLDEVRSQLDDEFARLDVRPSEEQTSHEAGFPEMEPLPAGKSTETASMNAWDATPDHEDHERVARVLESVAARVRSGVLPLHGHATPQNDAAALAAVLSALLGESE